MNFYNLEKERMIKVIKDYDVYIQLANENNYYKDGWFPVSIGEFYDNEFKEYEKLKKIIKDGKRVE